MLVGIICLLVGFLGLYSDMVYVYEKARGFYSVSKTEGTSRYWTITVMYFHAFILCVFISVKNYYPSGLKALMSFNEKSYLSLSQVVFILVVGLLFFGSPFYISGQISGA